MKQARALDDRRIKQALDAVKNDRERAMVLLSIKAGLTGQGDRRANLGSHRLADEDPATQDDEGQQAAPRTNGGRPCEDAEGLREVSTSKKAHVFTNTQSRPGQALTPNAVAAWLRDLYQRKLGWTGYSSHSGRRTFVTKVARKISEAGGSLRDVQALAGHESLQTTQRYIDVDPEAQKRSLTSSERPASAF